MSIPKMDIENEKGETESLSQLRIPEDRPAEYSIHSPAIVTDTKGGLRGEIRKDKQESGAAEGVNIISFGNCQHIKDNTILEELAQELYDSIPASERSAALAEIEEKMIKAIRQGYGSCYCFMKPESEWENLPAGFTLDDGSFYYNAANKKSNQKFNDVEAINMMSMLFCTRGGIITAMESGQLETANLVRFVGYLAYGGTSITQNPDEGYYMLYDGPTVASAGEEHTFRDIYAMHGLTPNEKSGALQGYGDEGSRLNTLTNTIKYEGGDDYNPSNGVLYHDGINRHAIAIGPQLQNPQFKPKINGVAGEEMIYGTCVDVTIELEGQTYYIPAVIVDTKGHTAPYGYVQTGEYFTTPGNEKKNVCDIKKDISEGAKEENYSVTPNIVEWYVIQNEDGKNKSTGLNAFSKTGSIIIYRDEIALEKTNE